MPATVTLYHNPRCSKSREALRLLEQRGVELEVIRYLDEPPSPAALRRLLKRLERQAVCRANRLSRKRQTRAPIQRADRWPFEGIGGPSLIGGPPIPSILPAGKLIGALGLTAHELLRPKEPAYRELALSKASSTEQICAAISAHPILLERPIASVGDRAVIGRPPERVLELLE